MIRGAGELVWQLPAQYLETWRVIVDLMASRGQGMSGAIAGTVTHQCKTLQKSKLQERRIYSSDSLLSSISAVSVFSISGSSSVEGGRVNVSFMTTLLTSG